MSEKFGPLARRAGLMLRHSAVALIAGVCRWRSIREVNARIAERSLQDQVLITGGVLGSLFGLALVAAQFGWIGILAFWLVVIVLVN